MFLFDEIEILNFVTTDPLDKINSQINGIIGNRVRNVAQCDVDEKSSDLTIGKQCAR